MRFNRIYQKRNLIIEKVDYSIRSSWLYKWRIATRSIQKPLGIGEFNGLSFTNESQVKSKEFINLHLHLIKFKIHVESRNKNRKGYDDSGVL